MSSRTVLVLAIVIFVLYLAASGRLLVIKGVLDGSINRKGIGVVKK